MKRTEVVAALGLAAALALGGCQKTDEAPAGRSHTSVLGGYGPGHPAGAEAAPLVDARGDAIPEPPLPANTLAHSVRTGDESALSVWVHDGHVMASAWTPKTGWTPPLQLEDIYGEASDVELAGNGQGSALAVWRHTVGNIQSLRFSRFDARAGWSAPDVVPGALPRPDAPGLADQDAPQLEMDAQGNVVAQWPSGFAANEMQEARYVAGQGWQPPVSERQASAQPASPASPAPSSAR